MFSKNQLLFLSLFLFCANTQCAFLMRLALKTAGKSVGQDQAKRKALDYCLSGEEQSELKEHLDVPEDADLPVFTHVLEERTEYINNKLILGKKVQEDLKKDTNTRQTKAAKLHAHQHVSGFKQPQEVACLSAEIGTIVAIEYKTRHLPRTRGNMLKLGILSFGAATAASTSIVLATNELYKSYNGLEK